LPVHQPRSFDAANRRKSAVDVAVAKRRAVIVAVVALGKGAVLAEFSISRRSAVVTLAAD
jgi:hypothetical protein